MVYFVLVISVALFIVGIVALYKAEQVWLAVSLIALTILAGAATFIVGALLLIKVPGQVEKSMETENKLETGQYTILYPEGQEKKAKEMSLVLLEIEPEISKFFGEDTDAPLTIRLTDRLKGAEKLDQAAGFYDWEAGTITMLSSLPEWEPTLIHEYVHYRSHQYQALRGIPPEAIPVWFEEGMAMYHHHHVPPTDSTKFEISRDLRNISSQEDFLAALESTDAYNESYFAVSHLVERYGRESISRLLNTSTQEQFYAQLEKLTQTSTEDFSASLMGAYMEDAEKKSDQINLFYESLDQRDFDGAERMLSEWSAMESGYTATEMSDFRMNFLLQKGELETLTEEMEEKLSLHPDDMRSIDYVLLAELYLLSHPEQASNLIKEAQSRLPKDATFYLFFNEVAEPYEQIAGTHPLEGYRVLIDKELFFNQTIKAELIAKWQKEFPNEDFGERNGD